jgi:hypothetical protein
MLNRVIKKLRRTYISQKKHLQYFFYKKKFKTKDFENSSIPLVTIFGSCRQDSIYNLFPVTKIRNALTYTHYTKEIIQTIQYCKIEKKSLNELVYFRSALLEDRMPTHNFLGDYESTDLFVIEIASRIEYKYKNQYVHHEAYDNPKYHHLLNQSIEISDLSDIEIENDLIKIRELLYPRKILIVTHIATKKNGRRFELVELIKKLCVKLEISVLDPISTLSAYAEKDIFLPNDSARHYTDFGHKIIQIAYKNAIDQLLINSKQHLVQTYTNEAVKVDKHTAHGFGDFLMGCIFINQISEILNLEAKVSFNNHPLSKFFYNCYHVDILDLDKVKYIFDAPSTIDFVGTKLVFSNHRPKHIRHSDKQFVIKNCLNPRLKFLDEINETRMKLSLGNQYKTLHIRTKDDGIIDENVIAQLTNLVSQNLEKNIKYLFLSNNQIILDRISDSRLIKTNLGRCHSGESGINYNNLRDTLIEFMLMTQCQEIIQLSTYPWGSNFSNIVSEIYDIPLRKLNYAY